MVTIIDWHRVARIAYFATSGHCIL